MRQRTLLSLTFALLGSATLAPVTAIAGPTLPTCAHLAKLLSAQADITTTSSDNQGIASPTATIVPATAQNAAYCNVQFQFSAKAGPKYGYAVGESQTIGIGVGLPLNKTDGGAPVNPTGYSWTAINGGWNGKVENLGGGGDAGTIGSTTSATNGGYVGSSTDTGHNKAQNGTLGNFGIIQATHQFDLGKINDFVVEGVHQQYVWAKWLAEKYYGQPAIRNYWNGCSTGGRQAFALAEKYGADFDGILAGAPAIYWQEMQISAFWGLGLINRDDVAGAGDTPYTPAQYAAAVASAIAACDTLGYDTVQDGVVDDPRLCTWSAKNNICGAPTAPAANCLDSIQAAAIDKVWDGPRNHFGQELWHPTQRVVPTPVAAGNFYSQDVAWDHKDLTFSANNIYSTRALAAANPLGMPSPLALEDELVLADRPGGAGDLIQGADFESLIDNIYHGPKHGKMIMWQGAADQQIFWQNSVEAYREIATLFGHGRTDFDGLQSWFRYYHAPGVGHCGGGVGASPATVLPDGQTQIFDDLVKWVENDVVPQSAGNSTHRGILATGPDSFEPVPFVRGRPPQSTREQAPSR